MMHSLRQDIAYAFKVIGKTPLVSTIAVISLALGIAANVSIFALLNSWLLRPLPYPDSNRLVMLFEQNRNRTDDTRAVIPGDFLDWQEQATSWETMIASRFSSMNLTGTERPEQITASTVTPNFFRVLGATPVAGRVFRDDEGMSGAEPVVILSETLWSTKFGRDPSLVGKTIQLNGSAHTVVGIMPETFDFLLGTVAGWIPSDFERDRFNREAPPLLVTGKLKQGVTLQSATAELASITSRLETEHPETNRDIGTRTLTLREQFPGKTDTGLIQILMVVVFLLLMVATANTANLLLAKTDSRQKEFAIRTAVGAGRWRIMRQLLTESVVLSIAAGVLGGMLGLWGIGFIRSALPDLLPGSFAPRFDANVLLFTAMLSLFSGLVYGISPAVQTARTGLRGSLVEGVRGGSASKSKKRLRSAFVIAQFAMALTVLVGSAVLTDLFFRRINRDPGFDAENLLTATVNLSKEKHTDSTSINDFVQDLERESRTLTGVRGFALSSNLPRSRNIASTTFTIDGTDTEQGQEPTTTWLSVGEHYFSTMDIGVPFGRAFRTTDNLSSAPVVMVNRRFVEIFFDGQEPTGERITIKGKSREITGVANDIVQDRLAGLAPIAPTVYYPIYQMPVRNVKIVLRAGADPLALAGTVRRLVWSLDVDQPVSEIQTVENFMRAQLSGPRVLTQILVSVGMLALLLAASGIYGVMAYAVSQETNEIGIRMALGARPGQVLRSITGRGVTLAGLGFLIGTPVSYLVIRFIAEALSSAGQVQVLRVVDPLGLGLIVGLLAGIGALASFLPARRATRIDPVSALREEG